MRVSPELFAEAYIERFITYTKDLFLFSPRCAISTGPRGYVLRFTAVGEKDTYSIKVEISTAKDAVVFTATPPFPMYLFAAMSVFYPIGFPAGVIKLGNTVRGVIAIDQEAAIETVRETATRHTLLEPADLVRELASFEGVLHEIEGVGYVSFLLPNPAHRIVDRITHHAEDFVEGEEISSPLGLLAKITNWPADVF